MDDLAFWRHLSLTEQRAVLGVLLAVLTAMAVRRSRAI